MTRWEMAEAYRKQSFNCAQCVLLSFGDLTGLTEETAKAIAGGLGGGFGGCKEEACGALSGAVLVLGLLVPHTQADDLDAKRQVYEAAAEFRRRFAEWFGCTRCGGLLALEPKPEDRQLAERLGSRRICAAFIAETVVLLEAYLKELRLMD